jgi:hypothetical protein
MCAHGHLLWIHLAGVWLLQTMPLPSSMFATFGGFVIHLCPIHVGFGVCGMMKGIFTFGMSITIDGDIYFTDTSLTSTDILIIQIEGDLK